jgi:indole-3-glycerol phosphate synthase
MRMDILETICEERRADTARNKRERPASSLEREASPPRPAFRAAGAERGEHRRGLLIAECKRASPSRGLMLEDYDPVRLACAYERGGAGLVSVLTEPRRFLGADGHLAAVRSAVGLPVLRKDFIVDPYQIDEAWAIGADAILLIADALGERELCDFGAQAHELNLSVLVELREERHLGKALAAKPDAVGVNSRDLRDFSVHKDKAAAMAAHLTAALPKGTLLVAESGMKTAEDVAALRKAGYRGFLVGEALATAANPEAAARLFASATKAGDAAKEGTICA